MATIMLSCYHARTHALLKDAPTAIIYDHDIIAIKFTMTQAKHKVTGYNTIYKVPKGVHEYVGGCLFFQYLRALQLIQMTL